MKGSKPKRRKLIVRRVAAIILSCVMLLGTPYVSYANYDIETGMETASVGTIKFTGTKKYDMAYQVLDIVNQEREAAGLPALVMDKDLLDAAMERAVEQCAYYGHERPDGTSCYTICSKMRGENIAAGYSSASSVMNGWMNSSGHRANILGNYTTIGIGCYTQGGVMYWVQCFGYGTPTAVSKPVDKTELSSVNVTHSRLASNKMQFRSVSYDMKTGEKKTLGPRLINDGWSYVVCELEPSCFNWTSSNPSVASVDENGVVSGKLVGNVTITGKLKTEPYSTLSTDITITQGTLYVDDSIIYNGVDYSAVYDYDYYVNKYPDIKAAFGGNKAMALAHFVNNGMSEGRQGKLTFDVWSYRRQYSDLRSAFGNNLKSYYMHYITSGKSEGRAGTGCTTLTNPITVYRGVDYSAVYDFNYYTSRYSDIKKAFGDDDYSALQHFVTCGMNEGRQGKATFDVRSYQLMYSDLRSAFGTNLSAYYMHYISNGKKENRVATGISTMSNPTTVYNGIDYSAVYDYNYYTNTYSDVRKMYAYDDYGALKHFVTTGMNEGRQGKASFNLDSYANRYPDLRRAFKNNYKLYYMHFIGSGKREGRTATGTTSRRGCTTVCEGVDFSAVYDGAYYSEKYPDLKNAFGYDDEALLQHFIYNGMNEGRQAKESFNVYAYKGRYADLRAVFGNNLRLYYWHYMINGVKENRNAK